MRSFTLRRIRYNLAKSRLRVPLVWYRHRSFSSGDVFIAEYPKSGKTWLRFLLFEVLTGRPAGFAEVNEVITDRKWSPPVLPGGRRLIPTHEPYRREYRKAVYLVRDARDVVLSEYAYETALGLFVGDLDRFIKAFVRGRVNGYGCWHNHVCSWLDAQAEGKLDLLVVRYEDMRRNPEGTLARIVEFIGAAASADRIEDAVRNNSLDRMREKEDWARKMPLDRGRKPPLRSMRPNSPEGDRFVRNGSIGGWIDRLTPAQVQFLESHAGGALARLGYPLRALPETSPASWSPVKA
jgi:hypothetical protein